MYICTYVLCIYVYGCFACMYISTYEGQKKASIRSPETGVIDGCVANRTQILWKSSQYFLNHQAISPVPFGVLSWLN